LSCDAFLVIAGLDPTIQGSGAMDARVKPGHDKKVTAEDR
jgi:hypothetical protein